MIQVFPRNILRFIILVLFQLLVLNNIQISGYINPYMYVLFILLMPFETPGWLLLTSAFLLGLVMDLFTYTPGMHTISTLFMAFLRPYVLRIIAPHDGYEPGSFPRVFYYGIDWFVKYAAILILFHHLVLFYIEVFRFTDFFATLLRVILSSLVSLVFIVLSQYVIFRK